MSAIFPARQIHRSGPASRAPSFSRRSSPLCHEHVVEKNVPDAFIHSGLERWLRVRDIQRLVIVGVSTSNFVEATARTAGNLGFAVQVVADATFTFAKRDYAGTPRTAEEVHAMSLSNLEGEYASITCLDAVLQAFASSQ